MRATTGLVKGDTVSENAQLWDENVLKHVANELGRYVYMLVDPRDGIPFYVGKGQGTRVLSHLWAARHSLESKRVAEGIISEDALEESEDTAENVKNKNERIESIFEAGLEPEIWIIRHGMGSDVEYTAVEAACIDLLRALPVVPVAKGSNEMWKPDGCTQQLTNARREKARGHGIILLRTLYEEMAAPPLDTKRPLLTITLGAWREPGWYEDMPGSSLPNGHKPGGYQRHGFGFKSDWLMSSERVKHYEEIAESAAGWWRINPWEVQNRSIDFAVAEYRGVTRALLKIDHSTWAKDEQYHKGKTAFGFEIIDENHKDPEMIKVFNEVVGPNGHRMPPKKKGTMQQYYWPRR